MAWTYDTTLPTNRDKIRLLIGDTISTDEQMSDEELDAMLVMYGSVKPTAIAALRVLASKYARFADKWVGDLKILASQKSRAYLEMAKTLAASTTLSGGGVPSAGGIYADEKQAGEENDSLAKPAFKRGVTDNPE